MGESYKRCEDCGVHVSKKDVVDSLDVFDRILCSDCGDWSSYEDFEQEKNTSLDNKDDFQ